MAFAASTDARMSIRVALHQANTVVGDVGGNVAAIVDALAGAEAAGASLLAGPELAVTGYPPEDLLMKPGLVAANLDGVEQVAARSGTCAVLVGFVDVVGEAGPHVGRSARRAILEGGPRRLRNAVAVCSGGRVRAVYHKRLLPNYGVFDEARWFGPGDEALSVYGVHGVRVGVSICEDLWFADGPVPALGRGGAQVIVNVNASPFSIGRYAQRRQVLRDRAVEAGCPIVYVNQVGGQDELVFDGGSMVVDGSGQVVAAAGRFTEELVLVDVPLAAPSRRRCSTPLPVVEVTPLPRVEVTALPVVEVTPGQGTAALSDRGRSAGPGIGEPVPAGASSQDTGAGSHHDHALATAAADPRSGAARCEPARGAVRAPRWPTACLAGPLSGHAEIPWPDLAVEAEVYAALVLGTRDYLTKNGFSEAVIGLSGGIDSSLVAAVAVDALGPRRVHGLAMPSRYSSKGSLSDARVLAEALGVGLEVVPIEPAHLAFAGMLGAIDVALTGVTDENLQSRLRGVLLMAVSNARGWIVLTTGNKSELATGYSTLYGDSAGGFAVIKDVPKTLVYRLCRYRNLLAGTDLVPLAVLEKPPSAELRPDQRDDQSLPPYDVLDPVLAAVVEDDAPMAELIGEGMDPAIVSRVVQLVDAAEYKRRQSPIGIRITPRAFGKDRRMPITHRFREHLADPTGTAR